MPKMVKTTSSTKISPGLSPQQRCAEAIRYPSYKSFDEFIDVERLKALDEHVTRGIKHHLAASADLKFYTKPFRLNESAPDRPGSRMIYLAHSDLPDSYFDLDKTELWRPTPATAEFPLLMDFIATLPFKATGRMLTCMTMRRVLFRRTAITRIRTSVMSSFGFARTWKSHFMF